MLRISKVYNQDSPYDRWKNLPGRIFLDTNIVKYLYDFGEDIYESQWDPEQFTSSRKSITKDHPLYLEIQSLQRIFRHIDRANFEFAISNQVIKELPFDKNSSGLISWVNEIQAHWDSVMGSYEEPFSRESSERYQAALKDPYLLSNLSENDRIISLDAIRFDCQGLLTRDRFADPKTQEYFQKKYSLLIMWPSDFIEILRPFQALYNG